MSVSVSIFWFRRDLRLDDNAGLYHALRGEQPVLPIFIFDTEILDDLEDKKDKRVCFIRDSLMGMQQELLAMGSSLLVMQGKPLEVFKELCKKYEVAAVYTNEDYEPYAKKRDEAVEKFLKHEGISFNRYKDHVIFAKDEVVKDDGRPYAVYTPYSKKWKGLLNDFYTKAYPCKKLFRNFYKQDSRRIPSLDAIGFKEIGYEVFEAKLRKDVAKHYSETRDIPGLDGTTRLSPHLRFGTVSIRKLVREALELNKTLVNEYIWRDFFQCVLWHFPHTVSSSFRPEYDNIKWRNNEKEFEQWCNGTTGYPIVDAGMRQLNETGWMHNRVRMITASFLCKHLLVDWRWGEAYFAVKLLDYDMAQNVGNWQWAAGSGVDAAPYFRIFNPYTQHEKFDPDNVYVKNWVQEWGSDQYKKPIVVHEEARERCLRVYKEALNSNS